jgi:hypothetical protein
VTVELNHAPTIKAMTSDQGNVASTNSVALGVLAYDADADPLSFFWSSSCAGAFEKRHGSNVVFVVSRPVVGDTCTFTVDVCDGRGGTARGILALSASIPVINIGPQLGVVWQSTDLAAAGGHVALHVTAVDPEGTPVIWTWSSKGGVLENQVDGEGVSDITWTAPERPGEDCEVIAVASDPEGAQNSYTFYLSVAPQ